MKKFNGSIHKSLFQQPQLSGRIGANGLPVQFPVERVWRWEHELALMEELEGVLEMLRKLSIAWKLHVQVFLSCFPSHFTDSNIISEGLPDWQEWGPWSQCSASCGMGSTLRARSCCDSNLRGNTTCVGNSTEAKDCTSAACQGNPMLYGETKFQRQYNCRKLIMGRSLEWS